MRHQNTSTSSPIIVTHGTPTERMCFVPAGQARTEEAAQKTQPVGGQTVNGCAHSAREGGFLQGVGCMSIQRARTASRRATMR